MSRTSADEAHQAVEDTVRVSYGRLVAFLASLTGDLAAAEDALSDAFVAALRTWPDRGIPQRPDSWLLTAARRNLIDGARRRAVATRHLPELARLIDQQTTEPSPPPIPDKRLELMFACTHPAIDPAMRSPLMLQTVLGLDAGRIASAFLVAPSTMGQRLVRVKAKIGQAGIPFQVPAPEALPERLTSVLDAVYAAYGTGWDTATHAEAHARHAHAGLITEALRLARILVELAPGQPEPHGLLALLLHSHARTAARLDTEGRFVPLDRQDTTRWDPAAISEAEHHLGLALGLRRVGPYQLHAAIQSVHNRRALTGTTDWAAITALYDGLVTFTPTIGAYVARATAITHTHGPTAGLQQLDALPAGRVAGYQPYWVARAHALRLLGDATAAEHATTIAVGLTDDPAIRQFLAHGG
ncbi:RNA polymerase sigma factor [Actinoplanes sp. CA-030573]|uniref:RNA polymerase sigma factor n=1 Tax=Actinoplanes sp. CA-030573 TaxID=3239898 RepID=UPI003D8D8A99